MVKREIGVQTVVRRASLNQIGVWILDGHHVYVAESTTPGKRSGLFQVKANGDVPINSLLLRACKNKHIDELTVVVIPKTITILGSHRAHYNEALELYFAGEMTTPEETARNLRDKAHQLVMLYQLCSDFLEKIGYRPQTVELLDPELASFLRQFADTSLDLYKMAKPVIGKYLKGDSKVLEAFKGLASLNGKAALWGLKCALETLELANQLRLRKETEYTVERLAELFLAANFLRIVLCQDKTNLANFAARGAEIYRELRRQNPELPDIAHLIEICDKVTAQTPYMHVASVTTASGQETCILRKFHARPDAQADIQHELNETYAAAGLDPLPKVAVEQVNDNTAIDVTCLAIASYITNQSGDDNPPEQVIAEMAREISTPCPQFNLDEALAAQPSPYALVLGALAEVHDTIPIGAVILLCNPNPTFQDISRRGGLDGGKGVYLGDGIWLIMHQSEGDGLLPPPDLSALTAIWSSSGKRQQALIAFVNEVARKKYENHATVLYILPLKVLQRLVRRHKKQLLEYLPPINL